MALANAMVSSSAPSVYSVQALVLLAEVGCCRSPHFVAQSAYGFQCDTPSHCADLSTSSGHGLPQRREGEGRSSDFPHHVLRLPVPEEPQVDITTCSRLPLTKSLEFVNEHRVHIHSVLQCLQHAQL